MLPLSFCATLCMYSLGCKRSDMQRGDVLFHHHADGGGGGGDDDDSSSSSSY